MTRCALAIAILAALAACGPPPPAPVAAAPKAAPAPAEKKPAEVAPAPTEESVEYAYSPVGKRDPFRSILDEQVEKAALEGVTRPDCGPLCKWELEQLKLVAVLSGISNPLAMVEDPSGKGYIVRRGTFIGKRNGKITQIRAGEVVVTEIYKDQTGKPHVSPVIIRLPAELNTKGEEDVNLLGPEVTE